MITWSDGALTLEVIDPAEDAARLGTRFCHGGYVWQVRDAQGRALLSGPEYPAVRPDPFNGQGVPEVFRFWDKRSGEALNVSGGRGVLLGVGAIGALRGREVELNTVDAWTHARDGAGHWMWTTRHAGDRYGAEVERVLGLEGRTLASASRVSNTGDVPLDVHWYPHPFFPLCDGGSRVRVQPDVRLEAGCEGFAQAADGALSMRPTYDWAQGCFAWLEGAYDAPLRAVIQHPVCREVAMWGDFSVDYMPIWANARTLSLEPHSLHRLAPGETVSWTLWYRFGPGPEIP